MITRFIIYGILGWAAEILWTGTGSFLSGNWELTAATYLWMFPIYGLAVFMEPLRVRIKKMPWYIRGILYTIVIFTIEYMSGWLLDSLLGRCPWDYSSSTAYHINGYIRLDFAPVWFVLGLLFEKVHDFIGRIKL